MKLLETLTKMPLPRLTISTLLLIAFLFAMEQFEWAQSVVEHLINMEGVLP